MNAEIIAVGTELLLGEILNSDTKFLAEELSRLGINVYYQTVVGDNPVRLKGVLQTALKRSDIIITSGGLGPTHDDITKETLAEVMGVGLELHQRSLDDMRAFFGRLRRDMPSVNVKQAMLPKGCMVLKNDHGTAPGGIIQKDGKTAIFLPGPPNELMPMYHNYVFPFLREKCCEIFYSKVLRIFGIGESSVEELLSDYMKTSRNPTIAPYAKSGEVTLRITAKCANEQQGEEMIAPAEARIRAALGDTVYGTNDDTLFSVVYRELEKRGLTISFAESCTGGMLAQSMTAITGASHVFREGFVTYADEAKEKYLGVRRETLKNHGAVSAQTAEEMAQGLADTSHADICVAVTGIAGPGGGSEQKPVGLVYVAIAAKQRVWHKKLYFIGSRETIRLRTCMEAMDMVRRYLMRL